MVGKKKQRKESEKDGMKTIESLPFVQKLCHQNLLFTLLIWLIRRARLR